MDSSSVCHGSVPDGLCSAANDVVVVVCSGALWSVCCALLCLGLLYCVVVCCSLRLCCVVLCDVVMCWAGM